MIETFFKNENEEFKEKKKIYKKLVNEMKEDVKDKQKLYYLLALNSELTRMKFKAMIIREIEEIGKKFATKININTDNL